MNEQNRNQNLATATADDGNAASETPAPAPSPLAVAIDDALRMLDDPQLTPVGLMRATLERARTLPVHESRHEEAAAALAEYMRVGVETLRADIRNSFARVPELIRKFRALVNPLPPSDEMERIAPILRAAGWAAMEIDLLRRMLKPDEKMLRYNVNEICLSHRLLTRRQIRDDGRPAWWKTAPGWNQLGYESQFRDGTPIPGEERGQS